MDVALLFIFLCVLSINYHNIITFLFLLSEIQFFMSVNYCHYLHFSSHGFFDYRIFIVSCTFYIPFGLKDLIKYILEYIKSFLEYISSFKAL